MGSWSRGLSIAMLSGADDFWDEHFANFSAEDGPMCRILTLTERGKGNC